MISEVKVMPKSQAAALMRQSAEIAFQGLTRNQEAICASNYACCQTCAVAELSDVAGFFDVSKVVYYHEQDLGGLEDTGVLRIRYFLIDDAPDDDVSAWADRVLAALEAVGLDVMWSGEANEVLRVIGFKKSYLDLAGFDSVEEW